MTLKLYSMGPDNICARDPQDVIRVIAEHQGLEHPDDWDPDNPDYSEIYPMAETETLTVHYGSTADMPEGMWDRLVASKAILYGSLQINHNTHDVKLTLTAAQWIAIHGRGFVASSEY